MSTSPTTASTWPPIEAAVHPDGSATVTVGGTSTTVHSSTVDEARGQVLAQITATASKLGRPVCAAVTDAEGPWSLIVHPDGTVDEDQTAPPRRGRRPRAATPAAAPAPPAPAASPLAPTPAVPAPSAVQAQVPPTHAEPVWTVDPESGPAPHPEPAGEPPAPEDAEWTARAAEPAAEGARGRFNRAVGTKLRPSPAELAHRRAALDQEREQQRAQLDQAQAQAEADAAQESRRAARERANAESSRQLRALIQTNFQQTRTILVANPKGGARKTTSAYLLAAVLGVLRGGYVIAWDANETLGTLGARSLTGTHTRTVVDLLEAAGTLDSIRVGDLDAYVRPQGDAHFDVLASDEDPTRQDMVDATGFATIHDLLERFYRLIVVDTGNNIRASHFRAALDSADQLVIPVAASHDSADVAEQMMRSLRASGHDRLVDEAVVLIHDLEPDNGDPAYFDVARSIAERFQQQAAAVLPVPFDPALKDGGQIDYARLSEKTQRAYQEAAGAIARTLAAKITQGPA